MTITQDTLFPYLMFNTPIPYDKHITLHPVVMKDILVFQAWTQAITVRKNSVFYDKKIIKMTYLDFLLYCLGNKELEEQYKIIGLSNFYIYAFKLLELCCKDSEVLMDYNNGQITINGEIITPQIFDDLRRIIIIQNDIDFDIDEFLNHDTEQSLLKAQSKLNKNTTKSNMEDYIDSLSLVTNISEERIMSMSIRKFWRYIKRYQLHENYTIAKMGECSGMVTFNEPIKNWMCTLETEDKYSNLKANENQLKGKIG